MADIEVHLLGRFSAAGLAELPVDVLIFVTPDHTQMLPVWVSEIPDLGGRPTDGEILATVLSTSDVEDPWFAQISTNSRGQMTAGLKQGQRYIDVRPSTLEFAWHAGVLFDVRVKESMAASMLPVNPAFIDEVQHLQRQVSLVEGEGADLDDDGFDGAGSGGAGDLGVAGSFGEDRLAGGDVDADGDSDGGGDVNGARTGRFDASGEPISAASLILRWDGGLPTSEPADVVDAFADMWKAMGLSDDLDDWLGNDS